ncbi:MAG: pantoate--beta-alanine ligase [Chloroflexi bacterium]|nr:pantoate--beta-alanine ligase [Chloroflexota bacterium]
MKTARTVAEMRALRGQLAGPVGFVPTMGFLHQGHLSLVDRARAENASVVVSIFVNPTQFGPREDYQTYPRDLQRDMAMLESSTDVLFLPDAPEMYPPGFNTWVEVAGITDRLEGASRPGHFRGVATVVAKLFNIVQPHRAYFGQKDAQQLAVIKKVVSDLNMPLEVIGLPTLREPDGLAMSSRNTYLNPEQRRAATVLYRALEMARQSRRSGERDASRLRAGMLALVQQEPQARVDYVSIADPNTLEELEEIDRPALASMAVWIGTTRLIDNTVLE